MNAGPEVEERGLTFRTVLGIVFASVVLMPVAIWMTLVGGAAAGLAFTTILFFIFVLRGFGRPLTKQEILLMNNAISVAAYTTFFLSFVQRTYFSSSPEANMFGITKYIPSWWVPANPLIRQQVLRTFLLPDWLLPILITIVTSVILYNVIHLSLGYLTFQLYVVEEKLLFPFAKVEAETAITLGEREPRKVKAMVLGFIVTFVYSLVTYGPYILGPAIGAGVTTIIPVPFWDLTWLAEMYLHLPGSLLGLATDPFSFYLGFVLPLRQVLLMLIGSVTVWIFGNAVVVTYFREELFPEWTPGFNLALNWQRSFLHVWASAIIGLSFAVVVVQMVSGRRAIKRAFSALSKIKRGTTAEGVPPLWKLLALYLGGTIAWTAILVALLPGFPILPLVFLTVVWPFISTIINARAVGEVGYPIAQIPVKQITYITTLELARIPTFSDLGVSVWFAPLPGEASPYPSGVTWCSYFYAAKQVNLKLREVVIAILAIAVPLSLVMSFIYTSIIWAFSPIPSQMYPWAQISWPIDVIQSCLWITRGTAFQSAIMNPGSYPILEGAFVGGILLDLVARALHMPFSLVALAVGVSRIPPYTLSTFLGHLAYRALCKRIGKKTVEDLKWATFAGIFIGYGVATAMLISLTVIIKSMWVMPY